MIRIISNKENRNEFLKMMAWIELCGSIGHTCQWFRVGVDGDGEGRLKFKFDNQQEQEEFDNLRKSLLKEYEKNGDLKQISFE